MTIAILLFGAALASASGAPTDVAPEAPRFQPWQDTREGLRGFFDKQNKFTLAVSVVAVVGAHQSDIQGRDWLAHNRRIGDFEGLGNNVLGTGVPGVLVGSGTWIYGARATQSHEVHAGQAHLEALLMTAVATSILKYTVNRDRPDSSDHYSFPSGHTSTMAASAMSLQEFYGWKVGVPAFFLTALTAASRISDDRHWFSDTVAGASLGILCAHSLAEVHRRRQLGGDNSFGDKFDEPNHTVSLVPIFGRDRFSLVWMRSI